MSPLPEPDFDLSGDVYRRRIVVTAPEPGVVVSHLVDDFHDFRVTLRHDGTTVIDCEATSQRWPWTTCPDAAGPLRRLAGMPLSDRFTAAGQWTDPKQNCTHQFDAACFAITHAATGRDRRVYDAEVQARDWSGERPSRVRLWVDGVFDLEWRVGWEIVDPQPPFDAAPWKGGFMRWADATLEPDAAERAITLRRACDIGMGRNMDLDAVPVANELPGGMLGICYTMQPGTVAVALRNRGSIRDFAAHPEMLGSE